MFRLVDYPVHQPPPVPTLGSSGVPDLDGLTFGVVAGVVWLIASTPRQGRTMLVTQIARLAGRAGVPVRFVLGDVGIPEVIARIQAATGQPLPEARAIRDYPPNASWTQLPSTFDSVQAQTTERALSNLPTDGIVVIHEGDLWACHPLAVAGALDSWAQRPAVPLLRPFPSIC